jgi:hypothetical protein
MVTNEEQVEEDEDRADKEDADDCPMLLPRRQRRTDQ